MIWNFSESQIDGSVLRIRIPDLTEERRKDLIKVLKNIAEKNKVSVRNIRREANDELKKLIKDKKISEDENKIFEKNIQKITDDNISNIDKISQEKEKEIIQVWTILITLPSLWTAMEDGA